jgi:hypothetical protein
MNATKHSIERKKNALLGFRLAEYSQLRAEILKRTDLQHQLTALAFVAMGTLVTVGLSQDSMIPILVYPILTVFLAAAWAQNGIRIVQLGMYIRDRIDPAFLGESEGWEDRLAAIPDIRTLGPFVQFASRAGLVGTQILVVLVCLGTRGYSSEYIPLLILDAVSIAATCALLKDTHRAWGKWEKRPDWESVNRGIVGQDAALPSP